MKLTRQIVTVTRNQWMTKFKLYIPFLFLFILISCKENSTQPTDSEKPTVAILYPANGVEVKADTVYKIIADAIDNKGIVKVEFYINGQNVSSDDSSPYEYIWNTTGLSGDHTIMAKGYDAASNIGTSSVISVKIKGAANHAPASPSNPSPANAATGISISPTLSWSCSDPDGDALTYDVYFGTSSNPTTTIATNQSAKSISRSGLKVNTTYYWKIVIKDSKGATTTGPEWSFITTNPPAVPSNPNPTDAASGISTYPTLSWSCSDPDGDALTYDVYFGTSSNPTNAIATNQSATIISRSGLAKITTYYWRIVAKDSKGATTTGTVWSFTTTANNQPAAPSNPSPANAASGISTYPTLSWSCSDPDGDALTYDVYFGTSSNPTTTIATNQSAKSIIQSGLAEITTYYWKIVAKDSKGATTSGTVWSFTTGLFVPAMVVPVTGGTFQMGSNDAIDIGASPPHSVTLSSFSIDKYEVTYEKWTEVYNWGLTHGYTDLPVGENGYYQSGTNNPITMVNWYDILKWCNARSEKDGLTPVYYTDNTQASVYRTGQLSLASDAVKWTANGYRLPTEAEWEFAARGGKQTHGYTYSGSNTIDNVAWYYSNSGSTTHTIGTKSANELGIYDMSGNVFEWCWDLYGTYPSDAETDPKGATRSGTIMSRVMRGGWFLDSNGDLCRVAGRVGNYPGNRSSAGFRCVQK
jgi:formylglycine-generating enzyme required for sulfatase activity